MGVIHFLAFCAWLIFGLGIFALAIIPMVDAMCGKSRRKMSDLEREAAFWSGEIAFRSLSTPKKLACFMLVLVGLAMWPVALVICTAVWGRWRLRQLIKM